MIEAQAIVIAWIVTALGVVLWEVLLLVDERRSLNALQRSGRNGPAKLVAKHDIRTDSICLVIGLIILTVGCAALVVVYRGQPPFSDLEQWMLDNFWRIIGYGVLVSMALMAVSGWWRLRDRKQLFESVAGKGQDQ